MRWCLSTPGSAEYTLPVTLSTSVTPGSPYNRCRSLKMYLIERVRDAHWDGDRVNSEMHLEAVIERVWICTWRLRSRDLRDALGGGDRASLEIHLEAVIERVWRYALGAHDCANLQAVIEWVWRYTWRPRSCELRRCTSRLWSIEFGDAFWGCDQASLELHLQAMTEQDWTRTWRRSIWREARQQLRLYSLVKLSLSECRELSTTSTKGWETGWERENVDLGMILYLV